MRARISGRPSSTVSVINEATDRARKEFEAAARAPAGKSPYVKRNSAATREDVLTKSSSVYRESVVTKSTFVRESIVSVATKGNTLMIQKMKTEITLLQTKLREQTQLRERDRRSQQDFMEELMDTNRRLETEKKHMLDREFDLQSQIIQQRLEKDELRADNIRLNRQVTSLKFRSNPESAGSTNSPYSMVFKLLSNNTLMDTTNPEADEPINNPAFMCPILREGITHAVVLDCDHIFDSESLHANWNHARRKNYGKCPCCRQCNRKIVFEGDVARGAVAQK